MAAQSHGSVKVLVQPLKRSRCETARLSLRRTPAEHSADEPGLGRAVRLSVVDVLTR